MLMASVSRNKVFTRYERASRHETAVKGSSVLTCSTVSASQFHHSVLTGISDIIAPRDCEAPFAVPTNRSATCGGVNKVRAKKYGCGKERESFHNATSFFEASPRARPAPAPVTAAATAERNAPGTRSLIAASCR